jgi:hypothetical protein
MLLSQKLKELRDFFMCQKRGSWQTDDYVKKNDKRAK